MPGITDRFVGEPVLKVQKIGHGTLEVVDIEKSRRFYEEVLGFDVIQPSVRSLMIRKGTDHTYAVVETGRSDTEMSMLNHNGLDVGSVDEVHAAYEKLLKVKDEYGIKQIQEPRHMHGDTSFFLCDQDNNWWEIVAVREGGYAVDFSDAERDLTSLHEFDGQAGNVNFSHTHDPGFRAKVREVIEQRAPV
jgi:catechol 2,3-dioxygenase-like lactoylglutathione lyase family enzyme